MKKLLKNKYAMLAVTLLIGVAIGAIFYPSKSITREELARYEAKIEKLEDEKHSVETNFKANFSMLEKERKEYKQESEHKISSLRTENTHLRQKTKETIVKIIKPDGTITEKTIKESDTEIVSQIVTDIKQEFNEKVTSIENKWKTIHKKRVVTIRDTYEKKLAEKQHIIDTHSKKETIKINDRDLGLSIGYTTDNEIYINSSRSIFGPVFFDIYISSDPSFKTPAAGAAIGITF